MHCCLTTFAKIVKESEKYPGSVLLSGPEPRVNEDLFRADTHPPSTFGGNTEVSSNPAEKRTNQQTNGHGYKEKT